MLNERLRELRISSGISQKKLADALGFAQSTVCDWENGKMEPTASAIIKLADYFNVSADFLLERKDI